MECHFCKSQSLDVGYPQQGTHENTEVRSCKCYGCGAEYDKVTYLPEPIIIPTKLPGGTDQNIWTIQYGRVPWDKQPVIATLHVESQEVVEMVSRAIVVAMGVDSCECRYFKGTNPNVSGNYVHMRNVKNDPVINRITQKGLWEEE